MTARTIPNFQTEAALTKGFPSRHFDDRERQVMASTKVYVDSISTSVSSLLNHHVHIGNAADTSIAANTSLSGRIVGKINSSTATITIGTPAVVTAASGTYALGDCIVFSTTGSLPAPFVAGIPYYVSNLLSPTQFFVSGTMSVLNHFATVGSQSGVHTVSSSGLSPRPLSLANIDVAAEAGIAFSKLQALPATEILIGSAAGAATPQLVSGDISLSEFGETAIQNNVISMPKMYSRVVTESNRIDLAYDDIINLDGHPVQLLPSLDVGFVYIVDEMEILHHWGGGPGFNGGGYLNLCYMNVDTNTVYKDPSILVMSPEVVTSAATYNYVYKSAMYDTPTTGHAIGNSLISNYAKCAIVLTTETTGPFTDGSLDNTLSIIIRYHIRELMV